MVKSGYKQTEIGVIPEDWNITILGDIADIISGGTPNTNYPLYWNGNILWCTPSDITSSNSKYLINTNKKITKLGLNNSSAQLLPKGTLLLCSRATIGDIKISISEITTNQGFKSLIVHNHVYNEWLYYYLLTQKQRMIILSIGSTFLEFTKKSALNFKIIIPPTFEEQKAIADVLSDMDNLIFSLEKLIAKKKLIKQGAMQELLTGKKRLPGFKEECINVKISNILKKGYKQTEIGVIPEDWEKHKLNTIIKDIVDGPFGSDLKTIYYTNEKEVRIIQLSNIGDCGWKNENIRYTTFEHAKKIKRCIVESGELVMAKMMPAGLTIRCPNTDKMYILSSDAVRIKLNEDIIDINYFVYFTKSNYFLSQINNDIQGSTRNRTSVSKIKKIDVLMPSLNEQEAIAEILTDMDNEIEALEKKLSKYQKIKQGMMHQLLTGKIRLI